MASLFTKIMNREIPATILHEDELCIAFKDIAPKSPHHFLVVPRKEIRSLAEAQAEDIPLLGHCLLQASRIAEKLGIAQTGYRTVINTNAHGGQSVYHLHIHVLGGRQMEWPPG